MTLKYLGKYSFARCHLEVVTLVQFHQHSTYSFYAPRSRMRKKGSQILSNFLCFWDLRVQKLLVEH